jgi:hypothetical protein
MGSPKMLGITLQLRRHVQYILKDNMTSSEKNYQVSLRKHLFDAVVIALSFATAQFLPMTGLFATIL